MTRDRDIRARLQALRAWLEIRRQATERVRELVAEVRAIEVER